ncbi:MAG: hypothetical protein WBA22_10875 [Candidatus Methanofastidiosia archaeon]
MGWVECDEMKGIKSVLGYDKDDNPVTANLMKVQGIDFIAGRLSFLYKGKEEAQISQMYVENHLYSSFIYLPDDSLRTNFIISDPSLDIPFDAKKIYEVTIALGTEEICGEITPGMRAPPLLKQLSEILRQAKSTAQIAALDPLFSAAMTPELPKWVLKMSEPSLEEARWRERLCIIATGLSDYFGHFVSAAVGVVNDYLLH